MTDLLEVNKQNPNDPNLADVLENLQTSVMAEAHFVKVGKIQSFDANRKTAIVEIQGKRVTPDGKISDFPSIECLVFTLQGGGGSVKFPIASGDECVVFFNDFNLDAWFSSGEKNLPNDARSHHISDGIALVGLSSLLSSLTAYKTNEVELTYGLAKIGLKGGKITITNGVQTLLTVINGLIDVIKALTAGGNPVDAGGQAALESYKTTLAALLY